MHETTVVDFGTRVEKFPVSFSSFSKVTKLTAGYNTWGALLCRIMFAHLIFSKSFYFLGDLAAMNLNYDSKRECLCKLGTITCLDRAMQN